MRNNSSLVFAIFLVIGDFLALLAAFGIAYILRVKFDPRPLLEQIPALTYIKAFVIVLPLWILVHGFIGLYSQSVYEKKFSEFGRLIVGSFIGILVVIGYDFVAGEQLFPARLVPIYGLGIGFVLLLLFRTVARHFRRLLFKFDHGISNVLIIGNTEASEHLVRALGDSNRSGQKVLAIVGREVEGFAHYQTFNNALQYLNFPIHGIIQTELYRDQDLNNEILKYAQENHVSYRFVPGNSDLFVGNIQVELFAGLPMLAVHQTALIGWGRILKRLFDLVVSTTLLFFLWPLLLLIALLVKLFDPRGPVFFRQTRLTRFDHKFKVYKFRSMKQRYCVSPEEGFARMKRPDLLKEYRANGDYLPHDPRLHIIGKFLRRTSLDELPQLLNVLAGDLSLVGPRALVPDELNTYERKHAILSVKSGLTGLAQISGRRDISFDERRSLDVYYVQNWSFWWDLVILAKTLRVVLFGTGAK